MALRFDPALLPPKPDLSFEGGLWKQGVGRIAGIDEAGRGALAGPVAAAAVMLPTDPEVADILHGVNDSKQLSAEERQTWEEEIKKAALAWGVGYGEPGEIDSLGIIPATRLAAQRALEQLSQPVEHLLLDYLLLPECSTPQTSLIKGDARSLSIACASILAKVARDYLLDEIDRRYPHYHFAANKGYGTTQHLAALIAHGPCELHRRRFAPLRLGQN
jgi:ribonuclease HII